jgi:hypothetical protein
MKVTPSQLSSLLQACIPARLPVLITGAPGIGKSDIVAQAAKAAAHDLLISHPVVEDPTDSKGLRFPAADGSGARFLPFGDLAQAIQSQRPLVWFIDDPGQASPAVQAAKMQLLLARRIGEHALPDHVTFLAATNRRVDNAGVSNVLDPLKSRFATIVELEPSLEDWTRWAVRNSVPPVLIAFLRFRPDLLVSQERTREIENRESPRTWGHVARLLPVLPPELQLAGITGAGGAGAAGELIGFMRVWRDMPSVAEILAAPHSARIPETLAAQNAIATALGHAANENNFDRVMVYADRLVDAGLNEFAVMLVSDAVRRDASLAATPAFVVAQSGPIGAALLGQ